MTEVTVPSLAKLNLDLRVLGKRADGFHELRTIFQTISLGDKLRIGFVSQKPFEVELDSSVAIDDNLILRTAHLAAERFSLTGKFRILLKKQIPMGAGLGGGSSNAASTLIALPALCGKRVTLAQLAELASTLGSDVPFFLHGGTAVGLGRGTELYPLPDQPAHHALVVASGIHVSTAEAYRSLRSAALTDALTSQPEFPILGEFQAIAWDLATTNPGALALTNDFEKPVFELYSELASIHRKLRRLGARPARMTGSGSALFGIFTSAEATQSAAAQFPGNSAYPVRFVSQKRYRRLWLRALGPAASASCFAAV